jgi:shikimate dehydrogenase
VAHSLSPALHGYWLKQYAIEGEYCAEEIQSERLGEFVKSLREKAYDGCNVTTPHKTEVMKHLDEIDTLATAIGAVNTIVVRDGKLHGTNTDAYGFIENLRAQGGLSCSRNKAVILGAGGAAKAAVKSLVDEGFLEVVVINRTPSKSKELQQQFGKAVIVGEWDKRSITLEGTDILVNTTSLGLKGKEPLEVSLKALPKKAIVHDIIYNPLMTPLLAQAQKNGHTIIDGLGMLLHQAVPAFESWFGVRPVVDSSLRRYMESKLV